MYAVGTKIRCINNDCQEQYLTLGNDYEVVHSYSDRVIVINDRGNQDIFIIERFASLDEPTVVENEQVYMFDVDDTLIVWGQDFQTPGPGKVAVTDPYDHSTVYLQPHDRHIKLLTQMRGRGRFIIVWSQSGSQWANAVVKALGLTESVDLILTKPQGYVDDLPCEAWMKNHIFIKQEDPTYFFVAKGEAV